VYLADGGRLVLNHETRLHVYAEGLRLFRGELYADVRKQDQLLVIATRTARVTVLGTKFNLRVVATKAGERVTLTVTEGLVELRNAQGAVRVPAGTQSVVAVQAPPTDPEAVDVASLIAWATEPGSFPSPESSLQLRVRPAVEGGVFPFDGAPLTFLVEADYGNTPYQPLTLTGTIRNKAGEEMATVEKEMGTERLRYRRRPWSSLFVIPVNIRRSLR
jgi:hypothetical protein